MKLNKTSLFLIPCVINTSEKKQIPISELQKSGFINAFIDDYGLIHSSFDWYHKTKEHYLYLLFKPKSLKTFSSEEEIYKKFSNWVDYYDLDDGNTMHVFKIKEIYHSDYNKFINGKYSQFSKKLKDKYTNSLADGIVNKLETTRQQMCKIYDGFDIPKSQEYMSIPDKKEEIYRYEELLVHV